ncbi:MAG: hypothetical protein ACUZ8H_02875, partial [Candidatus Anammoxibacter sp.]
VYFKLAQVQAFNLELSSKKYDLVYVSVFNRGLRSSIKKVCVNKSLKIKSVRSTRNYTGRNIFKKLIRDSSGYFGFLKDFLHSIVWLIKFVTMGIRARKAMGSVKERLVKDSSILFVTYFPLVDKDSASKGIFKNKYASALQERFNEEDISVNWLLMYVPLDNYSYGDAIKLGANFKNNKEQLFFLHEFVTINTILISVMIWLMQVCKFILVTLKVRCGVLYEGLSIPETNSLLYPLWQKSFVGFVGIEGIFYFQLFKDVFRFFEKTERCIYYAEMQAWEKALNAAKVKVAGNVKSIGFQHTSISKNNYRMFYSSDETNPKRDDMCKMPMPDTLACNGDVPLQILSKQGYPSLQKVEAIRQLYLKKYLSCQDHDEGKEGLPVLLVIGSLNKMESTSLMLLLSEAFPEKQSFRIWLKGHPSLPLDGVLRELNIDISVVGYEIKDGNIDKLLKEASIVMVGDSTVAIEALMFNCHVVLPVFNDTMFLSPLCGFEKYYKRIFNPDDLVTTVDSIINSNYDETFFDGARQFVSEYWELNEDLVGWKRLLEN